MFLYHFKVEKRNVVFNHNKNHSDQFTAITEFFIYKANSISEAILVHNLHNCGFNFSCIANFA